MQASINLSKAGFTGHLLASHDFSNGHATADRNDYLTFEHAISIGLKSEKWFEGTRRSRLPLRLEVIRRSPVGIQLFA